MRMDESNSPISFDKDYFLNQKRTADSAVYDQINAGDKSGGIGCQKCCSHAEIFFLGESSQRCPVFNFF